MLRWHGLVLICLTTSVLGRPALAQQASSPATRLLRSAPLSKTAASDESPPASPSSPIRLPQTTDKSPASTRPALEPRIPTGTSDRQTPTGDSVRTTPSAARPPRSRQNLAATLAALGVKEPYDVSISGRYLVAAKRDDSGLILCDVVSRRRLRELENSVHRYTLLEISPDARWIAGVQQDDSSRVDLWRADNGRHLATLDTAWGAKHSLEFSAEGDRLRVLARGGQENVFSIPSGEPIGGTGTARRVPTVRPFRVDVPSPSPRVGAAPSAPRAAQRSAPHIGDVGRSPIEAPAEPPVGARRPIVRSAPKMVAPGFKPPTGESPPKMAVPMPRAMMRDERSGGSPPPTFGDVGSALPPAAAEPVPQNAPPIAPRVAAAPPPAPPEPSFESAPEAAAARAPEPSLEPAGEAPAEAAPEGHFDAAPEPAAAAPPEAEPEAGAEPPRAAPQPAAAAPEERRFEYRVEAEEETASQPAPETASQPEEEEHDESTVTVNFATNRNRLAPKDRQWQVYFLSFFSSLPAFVIYGLVALALLILPWFGKRSWGALALAAGAVVLCSMGALEAYVRSQLRDEMTGELYGSRPTDISYGTCQVSVPPPENRQPGELNRPVSVWIFEAPENPEKHFMLRKVTEHPDKAAFYASLGQQLNKSEERAALLFIHGYNVSFEDAIFRTAQLAVDLKFSGAPITFSWPSYADPVKYPFDEQNAEVSIPAFHEFLEDLATKSGAKRVHIIAHSMGNRVLAGAMEAMDSKARQRNKEIFREVVLAAPDIDSRVFKSQVLPHIVANTQHCTLYASSRDRALLISRYFHNYQRLGETQPDLIVASGMDTIDASLVDTSLLGHSYIGDVQSIVTDLHLLVVGGKQAAERLGLEALRRGELMYWTIKPQFETATDPSLRR